MTYSSAIFQDRFRACGLRLLPLTLGHACLLDALKSPWAIPGASDDELIQLDEMVLCASVCSVHWRVASRRVNSLLGGWRLKALALWRRNYVMADFIGLKAWMRAQWSAPDSQMVHQSESRRGADYTAVLAVSAMNHLHVPRSEVLDCQITRLQYELLTYGESNGSIVMFGPNAPKKEDYLKAGLEFERRIRDQKEAS